MSRPDLSRVHWRKSTRSSPNGACVEVAAVWRKSSRSSGSSNNCVEVASVDRAVAVRDSKDPAGPKLAFTVGEWDAFVQVVRAGSFG